MNDKEVAYPDGTGTETIPYPKKWIDIFTQKLNDGTAWTEELQAP